MQNSDQNWNVIVIPIFHFRLKSAMTFEEVDVDAVADLGPEDVEAREVFGESKVEGVNNPFLDFLLSGGDASRLSVGGRRRNARIQSGETSRSDGEILDIIMQNVNVFIFQTQWSLTAAYTARILMRSKVRVWRAENSGLTQSFLLMKGKKTSEQETIQHINCPGPCSSLSVSTGLSGGGRASWWRSLASWRAAEIDSISTR